MTALGAPRAATTSDADLATYETKVAVPVQILAARILAAPVHAVLDLAARMPVVLALGGLLMEAVGPTGARRRKADVTTVADRMNPDAGRMTSDVATIPDAGRMISGVGRASLHRGAAWAGDRAIKGRHLAGAWRCLRDHLTISTGRLSPKVRMAQGIPLCPPEVLQYVKWHS